jgi:hypothetical protein
MNMDTLLNAIATLEADIDEAIVNDDTALVEVRFRVLGLLTADLLTAIEGN